MKLVWKLLRRHISIPQLLGFVLANLAGMTIIMLGLQFYTLFRDGLYMEITRKADEYAMQIKAAFAEKNIPSYIESCTNQQFVVLTTAQMEALEKNNIFEFESRIDEDHACVRFCTSWATKQEEIDSLVSDIRRL